MIRILIAGSLLLASIYAAHAFGLGLGNTFGRMGGAGKGGTSAPPGTTGKILLVDGVSFILQTDGTSKICLAGGC